MKNKELYYNKPQIRSIAISASEEYAVWGRGTGKTEGLIAPRSIRNVLSMPRSNGVFVASTYKQLLLRTLPGVIAAWERMGFINGIHFTIGKAFPKNYNVPKSYVHPLTNEHYIHFFNGSGIYLVSQDRAGSSNGMSVDWIIGDEAKLLNKERLEQELMPTNRGNRRYFGHLPEHHSLLFCTDMPTTASAKWILDKEKLMDKKQIDIILSLQSKLSALEIESQTAKGRKARLLEPQINKLKKALQEIRIDSIYFSEASAMENIEVLGVKYIKQLKRNLPDLIFRTSVLNERMTKVEHGFYPYLDEEKHGYWAYDNNYLDTFEYNLKELQHSENCQQDTDLQNKPIDIAFDYGASINTLVVGQEDNKIYRFINALFVKPPELVVDLTDRFIEYYKSHPVKEVNYYYDHTAVHTDAGRSTSYSDQVINKLRDNGWRVYPHYCGQAPKHETKYNEWARVLKDQGGEDYRIRFNRGNCKYLLISMGQAELKQSNGKFGKNKNNERNLNLDQSETTHFSDAGDTLFFFRCVKQIKNTTFLSPLSFK